MAVLALHYLENDPLWHRREDIDPVRSRGCCG
jgi:hypothetical protein